MDNLLPCPFCGGNDIQIDEMESFWDKNETSWRVLCIDCIAETAGDTKEQAIAAWSRRAQPENNPLSLDELRQMGGEPIWIKEFPPYAFEGYKVLSLRVVDVYGDIVCEDGDIYEYERYGKTWLAFRSKPKEEV